MTIFLIGMPASGKTVVGKALAEHLQIPFFDTDEIIANLENATISEIFSQKGEEYFRKLELELVENWKLTNVVVATGGGLPCHHDAIDVLNTKGITVWIQANLSLITERLHNDGHKRPMFAEKSKVKISKVVNTIAKERKMYYEKSKIKVRIQDEQAETVRKILKAIYSIK